MLLVGLLGAWLGGCAERAPGAAPEANVVFVVLDNVRADRLSQCGYERPTSPVLERLCARRNTHCACGAQAPGSWTLPTHASYFTGAEVPVHGAGMGGSDDDRALVGTETTARPLDRRLPTLAERFAERGYQTVAISGNPLVSPPSGLTRGFQVVDHAREFGGLAGPTLRAAVEERLLEQDLSRPLFLFVNIAEAHRPWLEIPADVGWLPPRPYLSFAEASDGPNPERHAYVTGTMGAEEEVAMLAHLGDVYDWALWRADASLGAVLNVLRGGGWIGAERPFRVVIVSDHGEHLGEHRLLGHGGPYLFEELTRVPLVVFGNQQLPELPDRISALAAHDLLLFGQLRRRPVRAAAFASDLWQRWYGPEIGAHPAAAIWRGTDKAVHQDGRIERYDLTTDPGETTPESLAPGPVAEELAALVESLRLSASGEAPDAEMIELLKSLGYL